MLQKASVKQFNGSPQAAIKSSAGVCRYIAQLIIQDSQDYTQKTYLERKNQNKTKLIRLETISIAKNNGKENDYR